MKIVCCVLFIAVAVFASAGLSNVVCIVVDASLIEEKLEIDDSETDNEDEGAQESYEAKTWDAKEVDEPENADAKEVDETEPENVDAKEVDETEPENVDAKEVDEQSTKEGTDSTISNAETGETAGPAGPDSSKALSPPRDEVEPVAILVLDLKSSGLPETQVRVLNDILGQSVSRAPNSKVTTTADIVQITGVEAQKQLLGCSDESSCLADLADDFGATYIVYGSVAAIGETFILQLTLFDTDKAEAVNRTKTVSGSISAFTAAIDSNVNELLEPIVGRMGEPKSDTTPLYVMGTGGVITAVGLVALIASGYFFASNQRPQNIVDESLKLYLESNGTDTSALENAKVAQQTLRDNTSNGNASIVIGGIGCAVGLLAIGVGGWLALSGGKE